jgi:hypothetical protein
MGMISACDRDVNKGKNSQPGPHVDVAAAGNLGRADEDMSAVATCTGDLDRVLTAVCGRRVERDGATLATVKSVGRPCSLVPSVLEAFSHLSKRSRESREGKESELAEHRRKQCPVGCLRRYK